MQKCLYIHLYMQTHMFDLLHSFTGAKTESDDKSLIKAGNDEDSIMYYMNAIGLFSMMQYALLGLLRYGPGGQKPGTGGRKPSVGIKKPVIAQKSEMIVDCNNEKGMYI
jgi:hypothetical protein